MHGEYPVTVRVMHGDYPITVPAIDGEYPVTRKICTHYAPSTHGRITILKEQKVPSSPHFSSKLTSEYFRS